ncbi:TonB-dependent receptor [Paucibacter sp. KCTC 42545]|uniref:TonB-dependent receptor n=1 Tax=Paucibacter sp. KCTC 42545 TaxID=1768242 RepID=UPI000733A596|nr:TonB-dependent receptor [Paucibacter sp. KCTC 42545]ALT77957.1 Oar protein [Paucibacter sp. KCTC 42545]
MNRQGSSFAAFSRTALYAAVAIVAAAPAMAQNTTSAIGGRVLTVEGKPLAGATVTIVHRESGSVNTLVTDNDGRYSTRGLRVGGPYTVTVTKGSDKEVRNDIYLQLAETLSLDVQLGTSVLSTVVVTGSGASSKFNSDNMGAGTAISRKELDAYASIARSLQDYARMDPRLAQTDKDRGEISALGQNARFNTITIDGVRTNDTFGLEGNNLPTAKQPISIDAIEAVQVNLSNFDVTQQGYTGANINAVTKSGTNELKGSLYYVYRDDKLSGKRYNRTTDSYYDASAFKEDTKGFTLGGPIIKDKLFFFGSYEDFKSSRAAPSFGPVGSNMTNVGITPEQIAKAQTVAKAYGLDIGNSDTTGTFLTVKDYLLKLDWNINSQHRANLRYAKTEQAEPTYAGLNSSSLSLSSYWWTQKKTIETVVGQWFADWTPDLSTEFKLSKRDYDSVPKNNANLPQIQLVYPADATNKSDRSLFFGTENSRQFNILRTKTWDGYFAANWFIDDHQLKFGGDYSSNDTYNAFLQNTSGNYSFKGTDPAALWAAGIPSTYAVQLPLPGKALEDGVAQWKLNNLGLFVQDTWTVNKNLNLTFGLRLDRASTPDTPIRNGAAQTAFGYDNGQTIDGQTLVQPRVGFNYAFEGLEKKKAQLRGGFGLFQGSAANVWLSNPYSNTGAATATFNCGPTSTPCASTKFTADPANQPNVAGQPPALAVDILSPDLKQPSVWKLNLGLDTELPWGGLVAGVDYLYTKTKDGIYYRHLNLGAPVSTGPDGREIYYNAAGQDVKCWTDGGSTATDKCGAQAKAGRNTKFGNVLLAEHTSQGGGNAVTLQLSQQNQGWSWNTAYTRTAAKEVSPLTSSTSSSNYANRATFNPNEEVNATSATLIQDRVTAAVNWSKAFIGKYKTTVGMVYEGRTGKPYSWTFKNDMNGDGYSGNDLMYIPTAPGSGEVIFRGSKANGLSAQAAEDLFWSVVNENADLSKARGSVIGRNSAKSKFANTFDLRLSQEVPGFGANHKGVVTFDVLNFGNLLNKKWGHIDEIPFTAGGGNGGNRRGFVNFAGIQNGKYVYSVVGADDYETRQNKGESQWAVQVTARYEF